jgi:serine/threonine-protein kinase PRP4
MASRRSTSPSTPSEGEIIESGSETKATTSHTSINGLNVDRRTRISTSFSPRSPASVEVRSPRRHRSRSESRSRSRSYSPHRVHRGEKRRRRNDYDERRHGHDSQRRRGSRYDDRSYDSNYYSRRQRSYYDYDRTDSYSNSLHYNDDYETRREKRQRTRSRSPYSDGHRIPGQSASRDPGRRSRDPSKLRQDISRRRSSLEQSVSEQGNSPVVAQQNKDEAELRENQVKQEDVSNAPQSPLIEYVLILSLVFALEIFAKVLV